MEGFRVGNEFRGEFRGHSTQFREIGIVSLESRVKEKKMKINIVILFVFSMLFSVFGCSAKFMTLDVNYVPSNLPVVAHKTNLFIEKFDDVRNRTEPNVIGIAKTGALNITTPIVLKTTVSETLAEVFKMAFTEAGFTVVNDKAGSDLTLKGRINTFWVQEHATGWTPEYAEANIELDLALVDSKNGKTLWYDVKISHEKSKGGFMDATSYNKIVMNDAINGIMKNVMNDNELKVRINSLYSGE
jgi:uncharacterized lipoprotein YajG